MRINCGDDAWCAPAQGLNSTSTEKTRPVWPNWQGFAQPPRRWRSAPHKHKLKLLGRRNTSQAYNVRSRQFKLQDINELCTTFGGSELEGRLVSQCAGSAGLKLEICENLFWVYPRRVAVWGTEYLLPNGDDALEEVIKTVASDNE